MKYMILLMAAMLSGLSPIFSSAHRAFKRDCRLSSNDRFVMEKMPWGKHIIDLLSQRVANVLLEVYDFNMHDTKMIMAYANPDHQIEVIDLDAKKSLCHAGAFEPPTSPNHAYPRCYFSNYPSPLIAIPHQVKNHVCVWDYVAGKLVSQIPLDDEVDQVHRIEWSARNNLLACIYAVRKGSAHIVSIFDMCKAENPSLKRRLPIGSPEQTHCMLEDECVVYTPKSTSPVLQVAVLDRYEPDYVLNTQGNTAYPIVAHPTKSSVIACLRMSDREIQVWDVVKQTKTSSFKIPLLYTSIKYTMGLIGNPDCHFVVQGTTPENRTIERVSTFDEQGNSIRWWDVALMHARIDKTGRKIMGYSMGYSEMQYCVFDIATMLRNPGKK